MQEANNGIQDQEGNKQEGNKNDERLNKLLSSLKLKDEELNALKSNENLLNTVASALEQKKLANSEARRYREHIEKENEEKKKREESELAEKGEFKKLYDDLLNKMNEKEEKLKTFKIDSELKVLAVKNKIKKDDYLKLFDKSKLEISEDGTIKDLDTLFEQFKTDNLDLFGQSEDKKITPNNAKPAMVGNLQNINLEELRTKATQTQDKNDLALLLMKQRELKNKT